MDNHTGKKTQLKELLKTATLCAYYQCKEENLGTWQVH